MIKKIMVLGFCGLWIWVNASGVLGAPVKSTGKKQRPVAEKKAAPVKEDKGTGEIDDLKAEMAGAFADLKGQIEKVAKDDKEPKVSGVIFYQFEKALQNVARNSNFDLTRVYLTYKDKLARGIPMRVTLDGERITGVAATRQNFFNFLKYAYFDMPDTIPAEWKIRVGLQHTLWIDWADSFWGNRYIAKVLVDNEGVMSSADFGVAGVGKVSIPGLPETEFHATMMNGAGFRSAETNSAKHFGLRLNADLYKDKVSGTVTGGGFVHIADALAGGSPPMQGGVLVGYKHPNMGRAYAEYLYGTGISGYTLAGQYQLLPELGLIARFDSYDPNRSTANNEISRGFYGTALDWGKNLKLALDIQTRTVGSGATESTLFAHSMVSF